MAFTLPTFNIECNIWKNEAAATFLAPPTDPPDYPLVPCNLALGRRVSFTGSVGPWLLIPKGHEIFDGTEGWELLVKGPSWVEAPAGTENYYIVELAHNNAVGFDNEHIAIAMYKTTNKGTY